MRDNQEVAVPGGLSLFPSPQETIVMSDYEILDPRFQKPHNLARQARTPADRLPLGRGSRLCAGGQTPPVVRHSQRPRDALRRRRWIGQRVRDRPRQSERPYAGRHGPRRRLRAGRPQDFPPRTRRKLEGPRRPLWRESGSIRPTTSWCGATARSGSPIRATASRAITKAMRSSPRSAPPTSIAWTKDQTPSPSSPTWCSRTGSQLSPERKDALRHQFRREPCPRSAQGNSGLRCRDRQPSATFESVFSVPDGNA